MSDSPKPKPVRKAPSSAQVTAANTAADLSRAPMPARPHQAIPLGSMLGKYKVYAVLGRGGMGNVYGAEEPLIKRKVAIKMLPPEMARDTEVIKRFLSEAQAAGKLNHPNVVTIYEVGEINGSYFIVMELVSGGSVQEYLSLRASPGWRAATRICGEACKALVAAHEVGLIHRDIKPANLLLTPDGHAKVSDFGLAKLESTDATMHTQPGAILGTPSYMSPEQCRGDKLDARTDIYSLGCTYYAMLTGKPPFEAASSIQVMFAHCSSPIPDPRDLNADVPESCAEILRKASAKDPNDRYATARDMLNDLRAVLGGQTLNNAPATLPGQLDAMETQAAPPVMAPMRSTVINPPRFSRGAIIGIAAGVVVLGIVLVAILLTRRASPESIAQSETPAEPKKPAIITPAPAPAVVQPTVSVVAQPTPPVVVPTQPPAQLLPAQSTPPQVAPAQVAPAQTTPAQVVAAQPTPAIIPPHVQQDPTSRAVAATTPPPPNNPSPSTETAPKTAALPAESLRSKPPAAAPAPLPDAITNSIKQKLVLIKAGKFMMGDDRLPDASPRHEVAITHPFYMGVFEVTQGDFLQIMGDQVAPKVRHKELPAVFIEWEEADEFCRRLSELPEEKQAGRTYRLPTEAEWEYACRAGTTTRFAFGDKMTTEQANFGKSLSIIQRLEGGDGPPAPPAPPKPGERPPMREPMRAAPVRPMQRPGSFPPNAWGLTDMHGNVWEWCSDFYSPTTYKTSQSQDPTGPPTGKTHVARGGCWASPLDQCASAYRNGKGDLNLRDPIYGFRVVCEVAEKAE